MSSHSDIYETCVERNLGQKIRLLLRRQSFVKQPLQTHKLVHVPGEEVLLGHSSAFLIKFIYSEKATKFWEISTVDLTVTTYRTNTHLQWRFRKKLWPSQNSQDCSETKLFVILKRPHKTDMYNKSGLSFLITTFY